MQTVKPLYYDEAHKTHEPIPDGTGIDAAVVPVSADIANVITVEDDGLSVIPADMVSGVDNNKLTVEADSKLAVLAENLVKVDNTNHLRAEADGTLYASGESLSEDADNMLKRDASGNLLVTPTDMVSSDPNNDLKVGSDGKLFSTALSTDDGNLLHKGVDGGMYLKGSDLVSTACTGNPLGTDCDGKLFINPELLPDPQNVVSEEPGNLIRKDRLDGSAVLTKRDIISSDAANYIRGGVDGKLYAGFNDVVSGIHGNLVENDGTGKIRVLASSLIDCTNVDNLLALDCCGRLVLDLGLKYTPQTGKLELLNTSGAPVSVVTVPTGASVLEGAEVVTDPSGQPAGTYLKMTFVLADETTTDVFIDLEDISQTYTAGEGVAIENNEVSVKLATQDSGLAFDPDDNGLKADLSVFAGDGLQVATEALTLTKHVTVKPGAGIMLDTVAEDETKAVAVDLADGQPLLRLAIPAGGDKAQLTSFIGLRASQVATAHVLEAYDAEGSTIQGTRIILQNGLRSSGADKLTLDTLDEIDTDSDMAVNSRAVEAALANIQLDYDDAPSASSDNAVKSSGIYTAIQNETSARTTAVNALAGRVNALESQDSVPVQNSAKLVPSGGIYSAIKTAKDTLSAVDTSLSGRIATLEGHDLKVTTAPAASGAIYLAGAATDASASDTLKIHTDVFVDASDGGLYADSFHGDIDGVDIKTAVPKSVGGTGTTDGSADAKAIKASALGICEVSDDGRVLLAPAGTGSYFIMGFVRCKNGDPVEGVQPYVNVYVSGAYAAGTAVLQRLTGYEIIDPEDSHTGTDDNPGAYGWRNLLVLKLA